MANYTAGTVSAITLYPMEDYIPGALLSTSLGTVTFIANILTFIAILVYDHSRENYIILIASLNFSDILVGFSLMLEPLRFHSDLAISLQILTLIVGYLGTFVSHWHTVALSIDRLIAVQYALNYHSIMSPFRLKLLVVAPWTIGSVETLLFPLVLYVGGLNSVRKQKFISLMSTIHLLVIFFINAAIYCKLWTVARRQRRQVTQLQQQQDNTTRVSKATVMVIVIVALFGLLWGPVIIVDLWYCVAVDDLDSSSSRVYYYSIVGGQSISLINCVVYVYFNKNLRKLLSKNVKCKGCLC